MLKETADKNLFPNKNSNLFGRGTYILFYFELDFYNTFMDIYENNTLNKIILRV
jgi:hypothetical protein